jgi:pimeloyl-ACP methyl ester carboxylesterase
VNYFNGFSLEGESKLFDDLLLSSDSCVVGFSFGAQKAFEYVYENLKRVDRLILLSPAFFQTQKSSFIRTQLRYFEAGQSDYVDNFLSNVSSPSSFNLAEYLKVGSKEELEALLTYVWDEDKIQTILNRGTVIEVFFGAIDKIVDTHEANKFFSMTTNYILKDAGHLLKESI